MEWGDAPMRAARHTLRPHGRSRRIVAPMFDPFDETWWCASEKLNWWFSSIAATPGWAMKRDEAREWLAGRRDMALSALGLLASYRTVETSQLRALDPQLPAYANAPLYRALAGVGWVDAGFPARLDARAVSNPRTAPFMALRLPAYRAVTLRRIATLLDATPMEMASLSPSALKAARQFDRHNLIAVAVAAAARADGWTTIGEAWCRFDRICADPQVSHASGGPDLALVGADGLVFVELTASGGQGLEGKFARWDEKLYHPALRRAHVVWLQAGRGSGARELSKRLAGLCADRPRQHMADARDWLTSRVCADGWEPEPGVADPRGWARADLAHAGALCGFPAAGRWRIPERMAGGWWG